jgi:hypothetical protein
LLLLQDFVVIKTSYEIYFVTWQLH